MCLRDCLLFILSFIFLDCYYLSELKMSMPTDELFSSCLLEYPYLLDHCSAIGER